MKDELTGLNLFQKKLSLRLFIWSGLSIISGIILLLTRQEQFLHGLAIQCTAWGAVDAVIAGVAGFSARKKPSSRLRRVLMINTYLDIVYIVSGIILMATLGRSNSSLAGHGLGIIVQGAFLFFFDLFHARALTKPELTYPSR